MGIAPMLPSGWNSPIGVGQGGMIGRGDLGRGEGGLPHGLGGAGSMRIGGLLNAEEGPGERMELEREKKRSRHSVSSVPLSFSKFPHFSYIWVDWLLRNREFRCQVLILQTGNRKIRRACCARLFDRPS